jgi:hypothetical protein
MTKSTAQSIKHDRMPVFEPAIDQQGQELDAAREAVDETMQRHARAFWYPPYERRVSAGWRVEGRDRVEAIKEHLAAILHSGDLDTLQWVARDGWRN